ncbi:Glutamine synthetase [Hordeum vulgare]|nr:Glutamine synthetase [Hordeum vulgare]
MLAVQVERDLELQAGYFVGDYHLEDATNHFLLLLPMHTLAKEALEPTDQPVGIEGAADKANGMTRANGVTGVRCKYGAVGLWCKYGADGRCLFLARNRATDLSWGEL